MPTAYLIATYHSPLHLKRLVDALRTDRSAFFVHVDKKVDMAPFSSLLPSDVTFCNKRFAVYWGGFSLVEAELTLLRTALSAGGAFDRFVLLSGSEYPLYPAVEIQDFFERHALSEFMNIVHMPADHVGKPISRLTNYWIASDAPARLGQRILRKALKTFGLLPHSRDYRAVFKSLQPYGGSSWWALTRDACNYIEHFVQNNVEVVDFFRNTLTPDEMLFHTILGNSPFRSRMEHNLVYTRWVTPDSPSPVFLDETDIDHFARGPVVADDAFGRGEFLFARKFTDASSTLVDRLERVVATRELISTSIQLPFERVRTGPQI